MSIWGEILKRQDFGSHITFDEIQIPSFLCFCIRFEDDSMANIIKVSKPLEINGLEAKTTYLAQTNDTHLFISDRLLYCVFR